MSQVLITSRILSDLKPNAKPYFLRDTTLKGFGVKVNPSGSVKYVAEVRHEGQTSRKTLGEHPILALTDARREALSYIASIKTGQQASKRKDVSLEILFREYISSGRLKERTVQDYKEAILFYLSDWLRKPVSSITKQMVERKFYQIRDKGINEGKPTYSQATKVMRILSALMNYARADEIIENIHSTFNGFYAENVCYDMTRQWIGMEGSFEYNYGWPIINGDTNGNEGLC